MTTKMPVVVWGHKPEQGHTHSFIHAGFYKAFHALGHEVVWLDNNSSFSNIKNSIILTEGQVDQHVPMDKTNKYLLHNCEITKYETVKNNCLNIQVYTHDCLQPERQVEQLEPYVYYQSKPIVNSIQQGVDNRTLYMPWATNLLPDEITTSSVKQLQQNRTSTTYWVGSVCGGEQGNIKELEEFAVGCKNNNVSFLVARLDDEVAKRIVMASHTAPAVQGNWQVEKGYIPCRVFKNISYGRIPCTNNHTVKDLFHELVPYCQPVDMCKLGFDTESNINQQEFDDLVGFVKTKHTFLNRIERILQVL